MSRLSLMLTIATIALLAAACGSEPEPTAGQESTETLAPQTPEATISGQTPGASVTSAPSPTQTGATPTNRPSGSALMLQNVTEEQLVRCVTTLAFLAYAHVHYRPGQEDPRGGFTQPPQLWKSGFFSDQFDSDDIVASNCNAVIDRTLLAQLEDTYTDLEVLKELDDRS